MNAPWYRVAASFYNGATIPYILKALRIQRGASDVLSQEDWKLELHRLLAEMRDEPPPPRYVGLEICPTLDAVIVCVDKARVQNYKLIPPSISSGRGLYHAIGFTGSDLESLANTLWNQHEEAILTGRFSREPI